MKISSYVHHPEETQMMGISASSAIPSFGVPTTAFDQYRTIAIESAEIRSKNGAITDIYSIEALCRLAAGPIQSAKDIERAETALRAILLHDALYVAALGYKTNTQAVWGHTQNQALMYVADARPDIGLIGELTKGPETLGLVYAAEKIGIDEDNKLLTSTQKNTRIDDYRFEPGHPIEGKRYLPRYGLDGLVSFAKELDVQTYLSLPGIDGNRYHSGYQNLFYGTFSNDWRRATTGLAPINASIGLPPFVAIVLDRCNHRNELPHIVAELHGELAPVRRELANFNSELAISSKSQADVERKAQYIGESFGAIFRESRFTSAERLTRQIWQWNPLRFPLLKPIAKWFAASHGWSADQLVDFMAKSPESILTTRHVVNRTVTAATFAELAKTDNFSTLVRTHFSRSEIDLLEA